VPASVHLLGATTGAVSVRGEGALLMLGVALSPSGWAALAGPAVVDGGAVLSGAASALVEAAIPALTACDGLPAMAAVAEPVLRTLFGPGDPAVVAFVRRVEAWLAGAASPDVAVLAETCGLSRRQVERRCLQLYGVSPKLVARRHRALAAAAALGEAADALDLLAERGFYDQSHLTRELKQFVGLTPGQLRGGR
jgi:AraC-like DNA-binding protein